MTLTCAPQPYPAAGPAFTSPVDGRDASIPETNDRSQHQLQQLAAYVRAASGRRGLTVGERAEDMADRFSAISPPGDWAVGLARLFLQALAAEFVGSRHILRVDCDPALQVQVPELATIGMIVSEAVSNALKHAFPDRRDGRIWIRLAQGPDRMTLTIRDDGIGMSDAPGEHTSGKGLIDTLAQQLGGYARLGSAPFGGGVVTVVYPRIA